MKHKSRSKYYCVLFNFKHHLQKAFYDKLKNDHRRKTGYTWDFQRSKRFIKKNSKTCDLGALKWRKKLGKSQNQPFFLVFQLQLGYFSLFCKTFFFPLRKKKLLFLRFFYHKRPFAMVNFDFSDKCFFFGKCFLVLKNTSVITTWKWFLSNLWNIFYP